MVLGGVAVGGGHHGLRADGGADGRSRAWYRGLPANGAAGLRRGDAAVRD